MTAITSNGVTIAASDNQSPESFTTIGDVLSIGGPSGTAAEIDTTHLGSAAREFLIGLRDEGSVSLECNYDPDSTQHQDLLSDRDNEALRQYRITLTDTTPLTWTFFAYVSEAQLQVSIDEAVKINFTLRLTGPIVRA